MKVGFYCQSEPHLDFARLMLESVRKSMPGVPVHHFTDGVCPGLAGVDKVDRITDAVPMAIRRMMHHAACRGEWLFIDSDIIVQKDVSDVFNDPFDVALTDREGTITNEAAYAAVMPYNIGVTFSRNPEFWLLVIQYMKTLKMNFQEWEGDQRIICEMVKQKAHPFNVKILPGAKYNYPPKSDKDDLSSPSIVHWKGNRKKWMLQP